jgi:hypothetical protein
MLAVSCRAASLRWGRVPGGYGGWHAASTLAALIPLAFP